MNKVLSEILRTRRVVDRDGAEIQVHSDIQPEVGYLIGAAFTRAKPTTSLEVGFAYGVSTLYVCDALASLEQPPGRHIVIDPFQRDQWREIGLLNVERAGYAKLVELIEERSEIALPRLLFEGVRIQAAIIDGWHTFDHALVDFFFVNKMLDVGGMVILDDTEFPALVQLADHIKTYPAYREFATPANKTANWRTRIRRVLAERGLTMLRRDWDAPPSRCFEKIAEDQRNWDWHIRF